jgi:hypothetical protein
MKKIVAPDAVETSKIKHVRPGKSHSHAWWREVNMVEDGRPGKYTTGFGVLFCAPAEQRRRIVKSMKSMMLIYPPVAKPCEPPAGIAKLAGALESHGSGCDVLDANTEGILSILNNADQVGSDRWTVRAFRHLRKNIEALRDSTVYLKLDRYKRAAADINRVLEISAAFRRPSVRLSLGNYQHGELSPAKSADLIRAADAPSENPFYPYFSRRLRNLLDRKQYDVIGFSLNFLSQALCTFAMIGFLRREYPRCFIVLGGGLVTSWVRRPKWRDPFTGLVDRMVDGPGEDEILSLAGVSVECGNGRHYTPSYDNFENIGYLAPGRILPYSTSSGCYWSKCAFCPEKAEGNPYKPISPGRVVSDLLDLTARVGPLLIHLLDNAISPKVMRAIVEHPPGAAWYGFARITRQLAEMDFCVALRRSGCVMLKLGLESGDQGLLDRERKGIDLGLASLALKNLKKAGISTYVYLLFGTPSESIVEARRTLDFTVRHRDGIDFLNLAIFNLPNNGPDIHESIAQRPYDGDLSLYTGFVHPWGWDREVVRRFLDKEFRRHPAISSILASDPPFFTSNHAPFFAAGLTPRLSGHRHGSSPELVIKH